MNVRHARAIVVTTAALSTVAVLLVVWQWRRHPEPGPAVTPARPAPVRSGESTVVGQVVENNLGCRVDATCYLRLRVDADEVVVVYAHGESPQCLNRVAAQAGQGVRQGDRVEVLGRFQEFDGRTVLSTCDSAAYSIRVLP